MYMYACVCVYEIRGKSKGNWLYGPFFFFCNREDKLSAKMEN